MIDIHDRNIVPMNPNDDVVREPVQDEVLPVEPVAEESAQAPVEANGVVDEQPTWRTEAGRKGARRVHQLIEAGKRYEQEHGLKSGRQRLRQLIELGKLYEKEHGIRSEPKPRKKRRLSRADRDEVVQTLLRCLMRMAKPSFRGELERLAAALSSEKAQAA